MHPVSKASSPSLPLATRHIDLKTKIHKTILVTDIESGLELQINEHDFDKSKHKKAKAAKGRKALAAPPEEESENEESETEESETEESETEAPDYKAMDEKALQNLLRELDLPINGRKATLIKRLEEADNKSN